MNTPIWAWFTFGVWVVWGLFLNSALADLPAQSQGNPPFLPGNLSEDSIVREQIEADWLDRDLRFTIGKTLVGPSIAKSLATTVEDAAGGCDGIKNGKYGFHTASGEKDPWWQVDLGRTYELDRVVVYNRTDGNTEARTRRLQILVAGESTPHHFRLVYQHNGQPFYGVGPKKPLEVNLRGKKIVARVVRLQVPGSCSFALDEVEVYSVNPPGKNVALNQPADQKSVGPYSRRHRIASSASKSVLAPEGDFSLAHIRQVLDQAQKLAGRLRPTAVATRLEPLSAELGKLDARLVRLTAGGPVPRNTRREIYLQARWLARRIAFCNPLLDFDKLLFIKRHDAQGVFHMCDQFYGCNAVPGGGLFVLHDPFGPQPRLVNLLENRLVEKGRLAGQQLAGGSFLAPELSYDGRTILFAYTQAKAYAKTRGQETYLWSPEYSFHLFKANADGTGLVQLTDGSTNDFDPCFLPNGRIAFITERRGGYLRCGRHCPVYTLFSMAPDGSDIQPLSYHETHEWQPSVANDGRLVYTRWDYVDRDTNIAHHIWTCFPDGRDPRSFHGNYPWRRESRPWMEMDIRAIPGSHKFVAITGAHHGHAFGSLVLIDPRMADDGAMSQLSRLTPEVPFAEAEGRPIASYMVYGTPWPLSEDDYLCAYDPAAKNHGIFWIDRFGNKELIYRDPAISSISPIPLRSRPTPPVLSSPTTLEIERPGTVAVTNLYDSDFTWPASTKITALRIIQLLPKSTAPPNQPRIGVAEQTNARAILGTVPVEEDGSAHFEAPAGKPIYFQALDSRGLAVQSMRSVTYAHAGAQLSCQGCHEPKERAPRPNAQKPQAFRRPPSRIQPEVDGTNPFNYVRLVQPVLDRQCVACHQRQKALDLTGTIVGPYGWSRSYQNLAVKYGFYFHVTNGAINTGVHGGSRTVAGKFGAAASPLLRFLGRKHHGVDLTPEDFHRIALWLDSNSEFYGAYENTRAQGRGEIVRPSLE